MKRATVTETGLHATQANEAAREAQAQLMMGRLSAAAAGISSAACNGASGAAERDPLVILCGDFNDSPASPACQVRCLQQTTWRHGWQGCVLMGYIASALAVPQDRFRQLSLSLLCPLGRAASIMLLNLQVVRDHPLGLQCIWDAQRPDSPSSNGASCPEEEPFTTWKFRSDGASKRTVDFIW